MYDQMFYFWNCFSLSFFYMSYVSFRHIKYQISVSQRKSSNLSSTNPSKNSTKYEEVLLEGLKFKPLPQHVQESDEEDSDNIGFFLLALICSMMFVE